MSQLSPSPPPPLLACNFDWFWLASRRLVGCGYLGTHATALQPHLRPIRFSPARTWNFDSQFDSHPPERARASAGTCSDGFCTCQEPWEGVDCSLPLPPPPATQPRSRPLIYVYELPPYFNVHLEQARL